jgi:hypothetical protein
MPNGDPRFGKETLPGLEAFFSKLAPLLERFASKHDLKIEKYYHESHSWSLQFRHPRGGVSKIDVEKHSDNKIRVWACWWQDDYDKATRSIKRLETQPMDATDSVLEPALESVLATVLSWECGSWDSVHGGYADIWHKTWTKKQFATLALEYPELKK